MDEKDMKDLFYIARKSIEENLYGRKFEVPEELKEKFSEKRGVFVTIRLFPTRELRGCIGFPYPIYPLWEGVYLSAKEAAFNDPRFPPITESDYKNSVIEISLLTPPKKLEVESPAEYLERIKIGRDGLIIKYLSFSGLLLPQVPVEEGWDVEKFLDYTCLKAGLPPKCWLYPGVEVYTFQSEVWEEEEPFGKIRKVM